MFLAFKRAQLFESLTPSLFYQAIDWVYVSPLHLHKFS